MVSEGNLHTKLSPLDQIRLVEADIIRQIAIARETADYKVNEARSQVKVILSEARELGRQRGLIRSNEIISRAEKESHAILSQAHDQANCLRHKGEQLLSTAVRQAVNLVICLEDDGEDK